jgi:hypothetical protein
MSRVTANIQFFKDGLGPNSRWECHAMAKARGETIHLPHATIFITIFHYETIIFSTIHSCKMKLKRKYFFLKKKVFNNKKLMRTQNHFLKLWLNQTCWISVIIYIKFDLNLWLCQFHVCHFGYVWISISNGNRKITTSVQK